MVKRGRPPKYPLPVKSEFKPADKPTADKPVVTADLPLRGKEQEKNVRAPIGEETTINKMSNDDKVRLAQGRQARLDASFYERLPEYQDKQLFWENDTDGAVEKWLHLGAELVPRRNKSLKHFKGFTDRTASEWECVPVDSDRTGRPILCYLMFLPIDDYHALRIAPKEVRNQEILKALGIGKGQEGTKVMPGVSGIKTYAPINPVGTEKGFEQVHDA